MPQREARDPLLLFLLVAAAIYVFWDASRAFNQADEFWYAEVMRGLLSGDLLTHRLGPFRDFTKPPVFFWLSLPAAASLPLEPAMRIVPGLSFLGVLGLLYRLSRRANGRTAARLTAVAFLLCYDQLHMHGFRSGVIEGLLALEMTVVLWLNLRLRRRPGSIRWIAALLALTFMTKTAFVLFPLAVTACNLWLQRGQLQLRRAHLLQGVALALLVIVPWFAATCAVNGAEVLRKMFFHQVAQRAIQSDVAATQGLVFGRSEPVYALQHLLVYGQPWCLLIPPALWTVWRDRRAPLSSRTLLARLSSVWLLAVFGVFLVSRGVWGWYHHSLYAPAAILIGGLLADVLAEREADRTLRACVVGLCVGAVLVSPMPYGYTPYVGSAAKAPLDPLLWQRAGLAAALAAAFAVGARRGVPLGRMLYASLPLAVAFCGYTWWLLAGSEHDPTVALLSAPCMAALWLLDGARRKQVTRASVAALVILGVGYLAAPLRFAGRHNERPELEWLRIQEELGTLERGVEIDATFYSWVVLYHARGADYSITYERDRQRLRVGPKSR